MLVVHLLALAAPAAGGPVTHVVPSPRYPTIQEALTAARSGDVVVVGNGVWRGPGNRDLDFGGKDILLRSRGGADACVIDAEGSFSEPRRAFVFDEGESPRARVSGFTIRGGSTEQGAIADQYNGGAIQILDASPTIEDCVFRDNIAGCWGGALYISGPSAAPRIERCVFQDNYSDDDGGALFLWNQSRATVVDTAMLRNAARVQGGAIANFAASLLELENVTITDNSAPWGAGIRSFGPTWIDASIVWGNRGDDLVGGFDVTHSNVGGAGRGDGNIDVDPLFRADGYHLMRSSPCRDAGGGAPRSPGRLDVDGQPRTADGVVDMGADEVPGGMPGRGY